MQKVKQVLLDLGFQSKEIEIYLALNRNGTLSALQLSKETGIDRTNVYDILNRLINKGIASSITQNNTTIYKCLEPQKLLIYFKEKFSALEGILPDLNNMQNLNMPNIICETFQGKEGLKTVLKDLIQSKAHYKIIGMRKEYEDTLGYFFDQGLIKVNEEKIKETAIVEKGAKFKKAKNGVYKVIDKLSTPTTTIIYSDVVIFLIWIEPFHAIRIINKVFRKSQEDYFDVLWDRI